MRAFAQKRNETQQAKTTNSMMHGASRVPVEPKFTVNTPEDMYEREANRVADQVVSMPGLQRQPACPAGVGCPKSDNEQSGHEQFQIKRVQANSAGDVTVPPIVHEVVSSLGQALDPTTRGFMESRFRHDFSKVRVHTGARADEAARAVQARAFTLGDHIVFGADQYGSDGTIERRLLAHELTHVLQQRPGVDSATAQVSGAPTVRERAPVLSVQCQKARPAQPTADDAAFWEWWKPVSGLEGPLSAWEARPENRKYDRGGKTNYGVTIGLYKKYARSLGLPPTEAGFAAMTPDQATLFGRMMWKVSGAQKVKNTGVALVLADWYWGGIDLRRFSALLKEKGHAATFKEGMPDDATIAFMNTLPPNELVELMSDAKKAQYQKDVEKHPEQQAFHRGLLGRSEQRRAQAQPFVAAPESQARGKAIPGMSLWDRGQRALEEASAVLQMGEPAGPEKKRAAKEELWSVVSQIEQKQKTGFAHAEEEMEMRNLKGQLLKKIGALSE